MVYGSSSQIVGCFYFMDQSWTINICNYLIVIVIYSKEYKFSRFEKCQHIRSYGAIRILN